MSSVTTIIATRDRYDDLERTLASISHTERRGLEVEVIVVNNGGEPEVEGLVEKFRRRLNVRYVFESKPGKNAAINRVLLSCPLGDFLHFTDDDVSVCEDLYHEIVRSGREFPEFSIFGGPVNLIWPEGPVPSWARSLAMKGRAFSHLDLGPRAMEFAATTAPLGTNFWVRRETLNDVSTLDESIGPGLRRRVMGSETSFIIALQRKGHRALYYPRVRIGHHVQRALLEPQKFRRRALSSGRGGARVRYMRQGGSGFDSIASLALRLASLARWAAYHGVTHVLPDKDARIEAQWRALQGLGWNAEAARLTWDLLRRPRASEPSAAQTTAGSPVGRHE